MRLVRERHPDVPIMYYANGGSSYLELQRDMACDVISLDWAVRSSPTRSDLITPDPTRCDPCPSDPIPSHPIPSHPIPPGPFPDRTEQSHPTAQVDMTVAKKTLGEGRLLQGNVDPTLLFGSADQIRKGVADCVAKAGKRGHIVNLGHGVLQGTPEEAVQAFVDAAKTAY